MKNLEVRESSSASFPMDEGWVAASWIDSALFCEHGLYLEKVGEVEAEATEAMEEGTEKHEQHHENFQSKAKETEMTLEEASAKAVEDEEIVQFSEISIHHEGHKVYGRADRVKVFPDRVEALDFKNVKDGRVYIGNKFQALSYALMLKDALGLDLPAQAVILDRESEEEAWREPLESQLEGLLNQINRVRDVLLGKRRPEPTENENKCRSCNLLDGCGVSAL